MGAPKGNTNALKHGLYARHFSREEKAGLRKMTPRDYGHEIELMRVTVNNISDIQVRLYKLMDEALKANQPPDVDSLSKISNSLSLAMAALNTTARTQALFTGTDGSANDDFEEALDSLPIFLDEKYLIETNEEAEEREILVEPGRE